VILQNLRLSVDGGLALLELARPDAAHAIDMQMARELMAAAIQLDRDPHVRVHARPKLLAPDPIRGASVGRQPRATSTAGDVAVEPCDPISSARGKNADAAGLWASSACRPPPAYAARRRRQDSAPVSAAIHAIAVGSGMWKAIDVTVTCTLTHGCPGSSGVNMKSIS
jgi:hypothetical protein